MDVLRIDKDYKIKTEWSELTVGEAAQITALGLPEPLKEIYSYMAKGDQEGFVEAEKKLTYRQKKKTLPKFYGDVLEIISDVPKEIMKKVFPDDRTSTYMKYGFGVVFGLWFNPDYQPKGIRSFEHNGVKYYFPDSKKGLKGDITGGWMTTVEFAESADLLSYAEEYNEKTEVFPILVAILCRPMINGRRESYDEQKAFKRAEEFKTLTMDVVWEVSFFLTKSLDKLNSVTKSYLQAESLRLLRLRKKAG